MFAKFNKQKNNDGVNGTKEWYIPGPDGLNLWILMEVNENFGCLYPEHLQSSLNV